jgi:hypothetical protein
VAAGVALGCGLWTEAAMGVSVGAAGLGALACCQVPSL